MLQRYVLLYTPVELRILKVTGIQHTTLSEKGGKLGVVTTTPPPLWSLKTVVVWGGEEDSILIPLSGTAKAKTCDWPSPRRFSCRRPEQADLKIGVSFEPVTVLFTVVPLARQCLIHTSTSIRCQEESAYTGEHKHFLSGAFSWGPPSLSQVDHITVSRFHGPSHPS